MMKFDFSSKSSKDKILLGHGNKLFTKTNFTLNNKVLLVLYHNSCPRKISYTTTQSIIYTLQMKILLATDMIHDNNIIKLPFIKI